MRRTHSSTIQSSGLVLAPLRGRLGGHLDEGLAEHFDDFHTHKEELSEGVTEVRHRRVSSTEGRSTGDDVVCAGEHTVDAVEGAPRDAHALREELADGGRLPLVLRGTRAAREVARVSVGARAGRLLCLGSERVEDGFA